MTAVDAVCRMGSAHQPMSSLIPRLAVMLVLLVGCDPDPDRESDYRGAARRITGRWSLVRDDDFLHGRPSCFATLRVKMDSPSDSTALVTFCPGGTPELSRRVAVVIVHDPADDEHLDVMSRECRVIWDEGAAGAPLGISLRWRDAVYDQADGFYSEDVLWAQFLGPWPPDERMGWGSMLIYARDGGDGAGDRAR